MCLFHVDLGSLGSNASEAVGEIVAIPEDAGETGVDDDTWLGMGDSITSLNYVLAKFYVFTRDAELVGRLGTDIRVDVATDEERWTHSGLIFENERSLVRRSVEGGVVGDSGGDESIVGVGLGDCDQARMPMGFEVGVCAIDDEVRVMRTNQSNTVGVADAGAKLAGHAVVAKAVGGVDGGDNGSDVLGGVVIDDDDLKR